jgi:hypothetical protein
MCICVCAHYVCRCIIMCVCALAATSTSSWERACVYCICSSLLIHVYMLHSSMLVCAHYVCMCACSHINVELGVSLCREGDRPPDAVTNNISNGAQTQCRKVNTNSTVYIYVGILCIYTYISMYTYTHIRYMYFRRISLYI